MSRALNEETALTEEPDAPPPPQGPLSSSVRRIYTVLVGLVMLAGIVGAVRVWLSDRGLWNDELYIALNIRDVSVRGLFGPLLYVQVAPPGWLVTEKGLLKLLGDSEQVLRAPAMIATVATIVLVVVAARRAVGRWGTLVAAALVAFSPAVMTYAGELKQYAVEAAVALVLLIIADMYVAEEGGGARRRWLAIGWLVAGVVGALLSYTALLVIAAVIASVTFVLLLRRRRPHLWLFLLASVPVLAASISLVVRRMTLPQLSNQDNFFPDGLPPRHAGIGQLIGWLPRMWDGFVATPLGWALPPLVLLVVLGGLLSLYLRGRLCWAVLLAAAPLAAIGAAAVHGLPIQGRVSLYLLPVMAILVAACVDGAIRGATYVWRTTDRHWWSRNRTAVAAVLTVAAVVATGGTVAFAGVLSPNPAKARLAGGPDKVEPAAAAAVREVTQPYDRDNGRAVLRDVARQLKPGDKVLAYQFSKPLVDWYAPQLRLPLIGLATLAKPAACPPDSLTKAIAGASRVWYVHGARLSSDPYDVNDRIVGALQAHGRLVSAKSFGPPRKVMAFPGWALVDLKAGADPHPLLPSGACVNVIPVD